MGAYILEQYFVGIRSCNFLSNFGEKVVVEYSVSKTEHNKRSIEFLKKGEYFSSEKKYEVKTSYTFDVMNTVLLISM